MVENPCIDRGEDRCKFYTDNLNIKLYGHCLIFTTGLRNIKKAKDRFGNLISDKQIAWFNDNCLDYPKVEDMKRGYLPPSGCGITLEALADG
jgi:hypothetical protein